MTPVVKALESFFSFDVLRSIPQGDHIKQIEQNSIQL